jgi:hypothetical protein
MGYKIYPYYNKYLIFKVGYINYKIFKIPFFTQINFLDDKKLKFEIIDFDNFLLSCSKINLLKIRKKFIYKKKGLIELDKILKLKKVNKD